LRSHRDQVHTHTCTGTSGHQDSKVRFWDITSHYMHTMDLNSTSLIPRPQMHSREKGFGDNGTCCLINFRRKLHSLIILMLPRKAVRKGIVIFLHTESSTPLCLVSGWCLPGQLHRHGNSQLWLAIPHFRQCNRTEQNVVLATDPFFMGTCLGSGNIDLDGTGSPWSLGLCHSWEMYQ